MMNNVGWSEQRVVLVTGASCGIGKATAIAHNRLRDPCCVQSSEEHLQIVPLILRRRYLTG